MLAPLAVRIAHQLTHEGLGRADITLRKRGEQPDELDVVRQLATRVVHVVGRLLGNALA